MRDLDNQIQKDKMEVAKTYEKFLDRNGWRFYSGEEFDFEFVGDKCFVNSQRDLMTDGRTGAVHSMEMYGADSCSKIEKVLAKHEEGIKQCGSVEAGFEKDFHKEVWGIDRVAPHMEISFDHRGGARFGRSRFPDLEGKIQSCVMMKLSEANPTEVMPKGGKTNSTKQ